LKLCDKHEVEFKWTKGHAGTVENERCDVLANEAAKRTDLEEDPANQSQKQTLF